MTAVKSSAVEGCQWDAQTPHTLQGSEIQNASSCEVFGPAPSLSSAQLWPWGGEKEHVTEGLRGTVGEKTRGTGGW